MKTRSILSGPLSGFLRAIRALRHCPCCSRLGFSAVAILSVVWGPRRLLYCSNCRLIGPPGIAILPILQAGLFPEGPQRMLCYLYYRPIGSPGVSLQLVLLADWFPEGNPGVAILPVLPVDWGPRGLLYSLYCWLLGFPVFSSPAHLAPCSRGFAALLVGSPLASRISRIKPKREPARRLLASYKSRRAIYEQLLECCYSMFHSAMLFFYAV